jgi:group II intron reverse transcriptase/maturase
MCTDIDRIAELAKEDPKRQFYSIAHLITVGKLYEAFRSLRKNASAGIDGVTCAEYETNADEKIRQLHRRLVAGKYQVQPLRRVYIPKENGKQRPISIPSLEDKIVQKVVVDLMNAIYEQDFLDCSYGFRPGRSQHQALDEVRRVIFTRPTGWILEIDIQSYFDKIVRGILIEMVEKRVSDGSVLRLIQKWIKVGVIEDGKLLVSETGTGQGQPISPLLANVYLHHALDLWFEEVVKPRLRGEAYEIRFADDAILCFQHKEDAEKVMRVLPKRFEKYGLTLHPEKTRLIEFGRNAARNAKKQGKRPETFDFLGFTHLCARSRKGKFTVHVRTMAKRLRRGLKAVADWCKQHRHEPVSEQRKALNAKLRGHYQYYGRPSNYCCIMQFYRRVRRIWREWLSRRTRGRRLTWDGSHTRGRVRGVTPEEPAAGNLHGGVCEGGVSRRVMVDLNGHEAGNGGHSQRTPTANRDSSTRKEKVRFLGLDVHAETIAVAVAEADGEVREVGVIANRAESIRKLVKKLVPVEHLRASYEAGPTGYVLYWQLTELGVQCEVIAPTLVPVKPATV